MVQAISLAEKLDGGNLIQLENNIFASSAWSASNIGFASSADRQQGRPGSIRVDLATSTALLDAVKRSIAPMLLIGTVSVTETLLVDLLVSRAIVAAAPPNLGGALASLEDRLSGNGSVTQYRWALDAAHEMRILRNVLVHAAGVWSQRAVDDFVKNLPGKVAPGVGSPISINMDDLLAYRRVARTLLNAAAQA